MRKVIIDRVITRKVLKMLIIDKWYMPKGYELSFTVIHDQSLNLALHLVVGEFEEFRRYVRQYYDEPIEHVDPAGFYLRLTIKGVTHNYLYVEKNEWRSTDYGVICHELHHFVHHGLNNIGVTYGLGGEEVYAHVQGYFMEMVCKAFLEFRRATGKRSVKPLKKHGKK
jgi:hypothetical protein